MTASRIYKVEVKQFGDRNGTLHYIRASSRAQAERFAMSRYVTSCVASQDDIIKACEDAVGIEDATRKEAAVDQREYQDKD